MDVYDRVENFFNNRKIKVPREWTEACIGWLREEHSHQPQNITNVGWLSQKAFDQWLHTDLADLGCSSLDPELLEHISTTLAHDTVLQINSVREVGIPAYSQLQQLRKEDVANSLVDTDKPKQQSWEPKPGRMLLLSLTDGMTEVRGMEYSPVQALSVLTKPGTKVVVSAGVSLRRGLLLLTSSTVTVLGGAVDSLLTTNAAENVINRALGFEETDTPREYDEVPIAPSANVPASQQSQYYPTQQSQRPNVNSHAPVHARNNINTDSRSMNGTSSRAAAPTARGGSRGGGAGRSNGTTTLNRSNNRKATTNGDSVNQSLNRNKFDNLWDDSQAFGQTANSQQSLVDHVAEFTEDDFLDLDVEAALLEAEALHSSGGTSATAQSKPSASNSSTRAAAGNAGQSSAGTINITGSVNGTIRKPATQPPAGNNPFLDADFMDDCLDDEDFSALEKEVRLIEESQKNNSNRIGFSSCDTTVSRSESNIGGNEHRFLKPSVPAVQVNKSGNSGSKSNGLTRPPSDTSKLSVNKVSQANNQTKLTSFIKSSSSSANLSVLNSNPPVRASNADSVNNAHSDRDSVITDRVSIKRPSYPDSEDQTTRELGTKQAKLETVNGDSHPATTSSRVLSMALSSNSGGHLNGVRTVSVKSEPLSVGVETASTAKPSAMAVTSTSSAEDSSVAATVKKESDSVSCSGEGGCAAAVQSMPPFTYLCFLPASCTTEQEFRVKGFVMTLMSRLAPSNGKWSLLAKINDGTCSLQVDIHDQVLQQLIGLSVTEMRQRKARASADPSVRDSLAKSVAGCQRQLIALCCLLTLRLVPDLPRPLLTALTPLDEQHLQQLVDRAR